MDDIAHSVHLVTDGLQRVHFGYRAVCDCSLQITIVVGEVLLDNVDCLDV